MSSHKSLFTFGSTVLFGLITDKSAQIQLLWEKEKKEQLPLILKEWNQFTHQNWKLTFERKLVYILKLTIQDMVLDSYFR